MAKPKPGPVNAFAAMAPKGAPGRNVPQRAAAAKPAGPTPDMQPLKPAPISPKSNGGGHMGAWADKMHPKGRR